jgi:hypothetical protein
MAVERFMTDRELFKMALDALEAAYHPDTKAAEVMEAISARLSEDEITPDGWYRVDAWIKEKP